MTATSKTKKWDPQLMSQRNHVNTQTKFVLTCPRSGAISRVLEFEHVDNALGYMHWSLLNREQHSKKIL